MIGRGEIIERIKQFLKPKPELDLEEFYVLADELKQELVDELKELVKPTPPMAPPVVKVPEVKVPPVKVELERPPLERPIRTFSQSNVEVDGTSEFFKVEGTGELIFFTIISTSDDYRVKVVLDNASPPSYDNKTYSEYTLTADADPHLSADDDVIEGETIYKVTIKKLPFRRNCAGYISASEGFFRIIEAQLSVI